MNKNEIASNRKYKNIQSFIDNYRRVTYKQIQLMFPKYSKYDLRDILNLLQDNNLIFQFSGTYYSREFSVGDSKEIFGNDLKTIDKCITVLARLNSMYKLTFHKLCYYPETIKFELKKQNGDKVLGEICYVPFDELTKSSTPSAKRIGFFLSDEFDKKYQIQRIVVCDKIYQVNNSFEIEQYIHNINSYAVVYNNYDVAFYEPNNYDNKYSKGE